LLSLQPLLDILSFAMGLDGLVGGKFFLFSPQLNRARILMESSIIKEKIVDRYKCLDTSKEHTWER